MLKENITFPDSPGCYLFKDNHEKVIYVGKAKNLKKRVNSYLQKTEFDIKTQSMLQHVEDVDVVVTDTEVEALILENTLIKKHQPRYNIRLKDAKSHSYITLTNEKFPRLVIARIKTSKGRFYGPFISAQERDYILHLLRRTFLLKTCKRIPKKTCLRYHINLCEAPCVSLISKREYDDKIQKVKMILTGKTKDLTTRLRKEMKLYSEKQDFEHALQIRNEIKAVEHLSEKQKMQREKKYNEDILNFKIKDGKIYLILFNIYKGTLSNKNEFVFDFQDDFLEQFIVQFYSENMIPREIVLPRKISNSINLFLDQKKGSRVIITVPKKGEKKQLLELILKNIENTFFADIEKVQTLKKRLNLQEDPLIIECFDISHLSGTSTVGSMVQYRNGRPDKSNYRRFRIRTVEGIDDVAAISEVVRRRYTRLRNENAEFPDLIIVDGGRGQLNRSLIELEKLGVKIPIISIAKQFEEILAPGSIHPLSLSKKDRALHFLQEIRDETHRFAIKYNRLLRAKKLIE